MPVPETQITIRVTRDEITRFRAVRAKLHAASVIAPKDSAIHCKVYTLGLAALEAQVNGAGSTPAEESSGLTESPVEDVDADL